MECENSALQILIGRCFTVTAVFCTLSEGLDKLMLRSVVPGGRGSFWNSFLVTLVGWVSGDWTHRLWSHCLC